MIGKRRLVEVVLVFVFSIAMTVGISHGSVPGHMAYTVSGNSPGNDTGQLARTHEAPHLISIRFNDSEDSPRDEAPYWKCRPGSREVIDIHVTNLDDESHELSAMIGNNDSLDNDDFDLDLERSNFTLAPGNKRL